MSEKLNSKNNLIKNILFIKKSQNKLEQAQWYIINCNKGHEDKIILDLKNKIEKNINLKDNIFQIKIIKNILINKKLKKINKNIFPGYIFINMILNEDTWYDIRNTVGVNGFIGSSGKGIPPTPLSTEEVNNILYRNSKHLLQHNKNLEIKKINRDFNLNDFIYIISGALQNKEGQVIKLDEDKKIATINIDMFGRQTEIKVDYESCKKLQIK